MSRDAGEALAEELVLSASQVRCLASPTRTAILSHLRSGEPFTAGALASRMGIPLKRLYYHLHELMRAGLIRVCETRRRRGQEESVYGRVARRYTIRPDAEDREYLDAAADKVDAMFRLASKENRQALQASVERPEFLKLAQILRLDVCLSKQSAAEVMQALERVAEVARAAHAPGNEHWISITAAVLPLVDRGPARGASSYS